MINLSQITGAVETILNDNLVGYRIERSAMRQTDLNVAGADKGWIGIYRGSINYEPVRVGNNPFRAQVEVNIEHHRAHFGGGDEAEDLSEASVKEILDVMWANKTLGGYVDVINGFDVEYDTVYDEIGSEIYSVAVITVRAEIQTA